MAVASSDVSQKGWKKHIFEALVAVAPGVAAEEDLKISLSSGTVKGRRTRLLDIRRFTRGDFYTGIAPFPEGLLKDPMGNQARIQQSVREALENIEDIVKEAYGRAAARLDMSARLELERTERKKLEAEVAEMRALLLQMQGERMPPLPEPATGTPPVAEESSAPPPSPKPTPTPARHGRPPKATKKQEPLATMATVSFHDEDLEDIED